MGENFIEPYRGDTQLGSISVWEAFKKPLPSIHARLAPDPAHRRLLAAVVRPQHHPQPQPLATAEFTTLGLRLIKIGACITETTTRVRIAFTAACPEAALFAGLVRSCLPAGPWRRGPVPHRH
jgi:hypothetical protein